jgi:hypothetical protein
MKKKIATEILIAICVIFTSLTLLNTLLTLAGMQGHPPAENNIVMLVFTIIGTLIVYSHKFFDEWSLLTVIVLQYILAIMLILGVIRLSVYYSPLHVNAYRDGFRSFTIPYVIAASYYYYHVFKDAKRTNERLQFLRSKSK